VKEITEFAFLWRVFQYSSIDGECPSPDKIICMIDGLMTPKGIIESDGDEYNDGQKGDYKEYIFIYLHIIYMFYWKKHIYFGRVWAVAGGD
jgi:hypothetical protein